MTPPIDQRPSSSLLSFLQFVNFSKSRVDFGRAAPTSWQVFIFIFFGLFSGFFCGASGLTQSSKQAREDAHSLSLCTLFLEVVFHGVFVEIINCHHSGEVRKTKTKKLNIKMYSSVFKCPKINGRS